ncbi:MAG: DUF503 domain-containing protein [Phycisphaeraceae bacterium]|nr:DUF503 domain-containing protein [Phycisphaeraceae bacterium]
MFVAVVQFELLIPGAGSIKDKRRVVKSVKDRLHREHMVSVAEVAHLDDMRVAGMALTAVNRDGRYLQSLIDSVLAKLRGLHDAELGEVSREILHGTQLPGETTDEQGRPLWTEEERRSGA